MTTFFKAMVGLLLTLPVGAYFAGSYVASHADEPANARLVRVDHNAPPERTAEPDPRTSPLPQPTRTPDEGVADETPDTNDNGDWQDSDHSDHSDHSDSSDNGDHSDHSADDGDDGDDGDHSDDHDSDDHDD